MKKHVAITLFLQWALLVALFLLNPFTNSSGLYYKDTLIMDQSNFYRFEEIFTLASPFVSMLVGTLIGKRKFKLSKKAVMVTQILFFISLVLVTIYGYATTDWGLI